MLNVLKWTCFSFAVVFLLAAAVINGEYVSDQLTAESLRSAGQVVDDPVDVWPVQVLYLEGAAIFGVGFVLFHLMDWIGLPRKRRTQKAVKRLMESDPSFRKNKPVYK